MTIFTYGASMECESSYDITHRLTAIEKQLSEIIAALGIVKAVDALDEGERQQVPERLIDVAKAAKIAHRGTATIYRWAEQFGIGWKLPSGSWVISEPRLRAYLNGELDKDEEAVGIPMRKGWR